MNFFPILYPDELLYSSVARFCMRSGNLRIIHNIEDLFSTRSCIAVLELPSKLYRLIENMPVNTNYTCEYFIYNHTLFPFYSAFIPKDRAEQIISSMKNEEGSVSYIRAGLVSTSIPLPQYFRFCPQCTNEDIEIYGESYWHRVHHLPGVIVCPKHKTPIYNSVALIRGGNRQRYTLASKDNCFVTEKVYYQDDLLEKLCSLSFDVEELLNSRYGFRQQEWFRSQFRVKLIEKGYARMNNYIHHKKLKQDFMDYYGNEFLKLIHCDIPGSGECWLSNIVRDNSRVTHPLRYLLVCRFLSISLNDLFNKGFDIPDTTIGYLDTSKEAYQKIWEEKLIELTKMNLSIREIASILKSTPKTIRRHIDRLGIDPFWKDNGGGQFIKQAYKETKRFFDKRDASRVKWLKLHSDFPDKSSNQIRKGDEGLYSWLSRHDSEWLHENSRCKKNITTTIDWQKRDKELLIKIQRIVEEMRQNKPERICWTTIGSKLGISGWLAKRKNKLPGVKKFIESSQESIQEFQIRKLEWAVNELEIEGVMLTKWAILEKAGVKPRYINQIAEKVSAIFYKKGLDMNILL